MPRSAASRARAAGGGLAGPGPPLDRLLESPVERGVRGRLLAEGPEQDPRFLPVYGLTEAALCPASPSDSGPLASSIRRSLELASFGRHCLTISE